MRLLRLVPLLRSRGMRAAFYALKRRSALHLTCLPPASIWSLEAKAIELFTRSKRSRQSLWISQPLFREFLNQVHLEGALSPRVDLSEVCRPLDRGWSTDNRTGYTFPLRRSSQINLVSESGIWDARTVWEENRLHSLIALGLKNRLEGDSSALDTLLHLVEDWAAKNPIGRGINWTVSMEVAIRAINVAVAVSIVGANNIEARRLRAIDRLLIGHAQFIKRNIEISTLHGNHVMACYLGLFWIGHHLTRSSFGKRLHKKGWKKLQVEIFEQLALGGAPSEGSTTYHLLVMEMAYYSIQLAKQANLPIPETFDARIREAGDFLRHFTNSSGMMVRIGDSDDGRILRFWVTDPADCWSLIYAATSTAPPGEATGERCIDLRLLVGNPAFEISREAKPAKLSGLVERSGWLALSEDQTRVWARCGGTTLQGRGHAHADLSSLVVEIRGSLLLVDPGNPPYGYNSEERIRAISARAHNNIVLDGREYVQPLDFPIPTIGDIETQIMADDDWRDNPTVTCRHAGYRAHGLGDVFRSIKLKHDALVIRDWWAPSYFGPISLLYSLAPGHEAHFATPNEIEIVRPNGTTIGLKLVHGPGLGDLRTTRRSGWHYPVYGRRAAISCILITGVARDPDGWLESTWTAPTKMQDSSVRR